MTNQTDPTDETQQAQQTLQDEQAQQDERSRSERRSILNSSAIMAAGTVVSRFSGFFRSLLLAAALGNMLHADIFTIANTIPNMLYILLAGGVFNAVLVPQLVRAQKNDPDGGDAYTNRVVTLAGIFLLAVTVLLVVFTPQVMGLYLADSFDDPDLAAQRESVINFARYCLPQVFFYGMFVLVGQILNARGRFGPMMWAPIANNVISIFVLVTYLVAFGPVPAGELNAAYAAEQELLLGVGSTLGIVAQFCILIPYLRSVGFRFRPRFDFRNAGLGHTLRLGTWTLLFVLVNQIAYTVVVFLASGGTSGGDADGTGYTVYSIAFLIVMVPHSVITVSLATAILPRLSASASEGDLRALSSTLASTLRSALVFIVPFALLLPVIALDVANVISFGASRATFANYGPSLALFGPGIAFFTVHYLMLRGFYALERTRTVFEIQCAVALTNIVVAWVLVHQTSPRWTAPSLVTAYALSYAVGALLSYLVLRRTLGGLQTLQTAGFGARLLLAALVSTGFAATTMVALHRWVGATWLAGPDGVPNQFAAVGILVLVLGIDVMVFLGMARLLRLDEVNQITGLVTRRLRR